MCCVKHEPGVLHFTLRPSLITWRTTRTSNRFQWNYKPHSRNIQHIYCLQSEIIFDSHKSRRSFQFRVYSWTYFLNKFKAIINLRDSILEIEGCALIQIAKQKIDVNELPVLHFASDVSVPSQSVAYLACNRVRAVSRKTTDVPRRNVFIYKRQWPVVGKRNNKTTSENIRESYKCYRCASSSKNWNKDF